MAEFTLDTSGTVLMGVGNEHFPGLQRHVGWPDLDPFTQGYVEAALSCSRGKCLMVLKGGDYDGAKPVAFSDLAPETLALILRDCAAMQADWPLRAMPDDLGATFWRERQAGRLTSKDFPPLTPTLGDDGKVYLREGDQ